MFTPPSLRGIALATFLTTSLAAASSTGSRIHVNAEAKAGGDGRSWATAYQSLEDALAQSVSGDEVWLAVGAYVPVGAATLSDPREATFDLPQGVRLRGGFMGDEENAAERPLHTRSTLSGDRGRIMEARDNCYSVVTLQGGGVVIPGNPGTGPAAELERLVIRDGRADGEGLGKGAGVFAPGGFLRIHDCLFADNWALRAGGGAWLTGGTFRLRGVEFLRNGSADRGGALGVQAAFCHAGNMRFTENHADRGGAVFIHSIEPWSMGGAPTVSFHNSVFQDNGARVGGAMFLQGSNIAGAGRASLAHCTLVGNWATERAGAVFARAGVSIPAQCDVLHTILWSNRAPLAPEIHGGATLISSCIDDTSWFGFDITYADPEFEDFAGRDLHLRLSSPCVDAADPSNVPPDLADVDGDGFRFESLPVDLDGRPRVAMAVGGFMGWDDVRPDLGAFEN